MTHHLIALWGPTPRQLCITCCLMYQASQNNKLKNMSFLLLHQQWAVLLPPEENLSHLRITQRKTVWQNSVPVATLYHGWTVKVSLIIYATTCNSVVDQPNPRSNVGIRQGPDAVPANFSNTQRFLHLPYWIGCWWSSFLLGFVFSIVTKGLLELKQVFIFIYKQTVINFLFEHFSDSGKHGLCFCGRHLHKVRRDALLLPSLSPLG